MQQLFSLVPTMCWAGLGLASDHLAHACFNPFSIQSHLTPLISGSLIRPRHVTRLARFRMLRVNPFTAVGAVWNSLFCSPTYLVSDKSKKKKNLALFLEKKKALIAFQVWSPSLPMTNAAAAAAATHATPLPPHRNFQESQLVTWRRQVPDLYS